VVTEPEVCGELLGIVRHVRSAAMEETFEARRAAVLVPLEVAADAEAVVAAARELRTQIWARYARPVADAAADAAADAIEAWRAAAERADVSRAACPPPAGSPVARPATPKEPAAAAAATWQGHSGSLPSAPRPATPVKINAPRPVTPSDPAQGKPGSLHCWAAEPGQPGPPALLRRPPPPLSRAAAPPRGAPASLAPL
jgi:hypothetical protein